MEHATLSPLPAALNVRPAAEIAEFEAIVAAYRPKIFRFALASLRDRDAAETVAQDCFTKAFRARERFRGECSLDTWLMRIAVNLVRDYARNRRLQFWKRTQASSDGLLEIGNRVDPAGRSPETRTLLREQVQAIWRAAAELPEKQRTVFLLRFVEDMDLLEIAQAAGMKEGTVKTHLFRALKAVRQRLGAPE